VLGVVGLPLLLLSSVGIAGVWCSIAAVLHMVRGCLAPKLAFSRLQLSACVVKQPIADAAEQAAADGACAELRVSSVSWFMQMILMRLKTTPCANAVCGRKCSILGVRAALDPHLLRPWVSFKSLFAAHPLTS
jgi:hypothetical protein